MSCERRCELGEEVTFYGKKPGRSVWGGGCRKEYGEQVVVRFHSGQDNGDHLKCYQAMGKKSTLLEPHIILNCHAFIYIL